MPSWRAETIVLAVLAACESSVNLGEGSDAAPPGDAGEASAVDAVSEPPPPDAALEVGADTSPAAEAGTDAGVDAGPKKIFVTRATYQANFGGLKAADFRCQSSADAVPLGGTFVAWLSDSQTDAADRVTGNGPWIEVGSGRRLFADRAALRGYPQAPLSNDELGKPATDRWWTGTLANGVRASDTCTDWSSMSQFVGGMTGTRSGTGTPGKEWTEDVAFACESMFALVCLEQ
jgi:hypothetical protein